MNTLIQDALEDNYVSFENKIRDELVNRVADRIEQEKALIASRMMGEEDEQLDELSANTLADYHRKATNDAIISTSGARKAQGAASINRKNSGVSDSDWDSEERKAHRKAAAYNDNKMFNLSRRADKRQAGANLATIKLSRKAKQMDEDNDQIDELSRKTLANYTRKSVDDAIRSRDGSTASANSASQNIDRDHPIVTRITWKQSDDLRKRADKRQAGANLAVNKLARKASMGEENEQLDELSKPTLKNYAKNAPKDAEKIRSKSIGARTDYVNSIGKQHPEVVKILNKRYRNLTDKADRRDKFANKAKQMGEENDENLLEYRENQKSVTLGKAPLVTKAELNREHKRSMNPGDASQHMHQIVKGINYHKDNEDKNRESHEKIEKMKKGAGSFNHGIMQNHIKQKNMLIDAAKRHYNKYGAGHFGGKKFHELVGKEHLQGN